ncbi:hypothetical protein RUND412_006042 [Rhizina undulata]
MSVSNEEKSKMDERFVDGTLSLEEGVRSVGGTVINEWTPEEESALRKKLDLRLLPLATIIYFLCVIDRANVGNARIEGMEPDLNLVGFRFNWALTVTYLPFPLIEISSNILLKHIGPKIYIPFLVFGFGIISMGTAFVTNFTNLIIARAFLGIMEGGVMPGTAFTLSCFYKRAELLFRVGFFIGWCTLAGAFGGLLATALSRIPAWGHANVQIHSWRNIFFFEGLITIFISFALYYFMPASPESCNFLNERERWIAGERIRREHKEHVAEKTEVWHIKRAILNINNNACALGFFFMDVAVQSFSLFLPTILKDLGWTATRAQLLTVPPYVVACAWAILVAWLSDRHRKRGIYIFGCTILVIIGYVILITVNSPNIKYMAVFFVAAGAFPLGSAFLSWGLNNAAGPSIRAVSGGYIVSVGTCGAILSTWTYIPSDAPRYITGHSINLGAECCAAVISILLIFYCRRENRMRSLGKRDYRLQGLSEAEAMKLGYRHPEFRYME